MTLLKGVSVFVKSAIVASSLMLLFSNNAESQQWKCDCSQVTSSCNAKVTISGNRLNVTSSSSQCSWVQYDVNGSSQSTTFFGGAKSEEWMGSRVKNITVSSCRVCKTIDDSLNQNSQSSSSSSQRRRTAQDEQFCAQMREAINMLDANADTCSQIQGCAENMRTSKMNYNKICN